MEKLGEYIYILIKCRVTTQNDIERGTILFLLCYWETISSWLNIDKENKTKNDIQATETMQRGHRGQSRPALDARSRALGDILI